MFYRAQAFVWTGGGVDLFIRVNNRWAINRYDSYATLDKANELMAEAGYTPATKWVLDEVRSGMRRKVYDCDVKAENGSA